MKAIATKALAGLVLFASGIVIGFFGSRYLAERGRLALLHGDPRHFSEMVVRRISDDLDLTNEQRQKLRPIVLRTAEALAKVRQEQEPKIHKIFEKSNKDIRKLLKPDQQEKFTALLKRLERRRKALGHFAPPPPPPGAFDDHRPPPPGMDGFPPPPPDFDGRSLDSPQQHPEGSRAPNATKPAPDAVKPVQPGKPDTSGKIAPPAADK
ncbi:protein of unknown function Spy-related [Solidesulfovibrio fructosivorans JJ]]|uniref:Periplasmic heavy metal sensor n=1 Tax=Solidesulfovibrio fructosivorans JJ] TaxID=596151 RepID=E1JSI8_SOLFR|nr:hypothetical protein [Solidesulfovibrio fructosivorans]EFL52673.1 protein of unknown function Spy-related [Solidesulfovibrio fructosivorans JJ]]